MNKNYIYYLISFSFLCYNCSNFDEQEFTVLLPNAGEDQVLFTEDTGTTIQLNASASNDINDLGFEYHWTIISTPEGFPIILSNSNSAQPAFEVEEEVSGRCEFSVEIFRDKQVAKDFVNIDINPAFTQVLFVNAIDAEETAIFNGLQLILLERQLLLKIRV